VNEKVVKFSETTKVYKNAFRLRDSTD